MATVELREQPPVKYSDLDEEKIVEILQQHVLDGTIVESYALGVGSERTP